jgi:hypothetical protein
VSGTYRDELEAAQARASSLEARLSEAEAKITELESPKREKKVSKKKAKPAPQSARSIRFHVPSYVPLLRIWAQAFRSLRVRAVPHLESGSVIGSLFYRSFGTPVLHVLRALGFVYQYTVVLFWSLALTLIATVLVFPIVVLSGLRFVGAPQDKESWLSGEGGNWWSLFSCMILLGPAIMLYTAAFDPDA